MKHKLIIVDGPCTVGKSSISKLVFEQINRQEEICWLHEECDEHPIRDGEFSAGDFQTVEGMELNRDDMLKRWEAFRDDILSRDKVCITEGCLIHSIDRYLIESIWTEEQIKEYFSQVVEILKPVNPLMVFLNRPDMKLSYEKAFKARGDWWREIIMKEPEPVGYFAKHEYTGDESMFGLLQYEQDLMASVFETFTCDKIKVDTTDEHWNEFTTSIVEKAGYSFEEISFECPPVELYCGEYRAEGIDGSWKINFDEEKGLIYSTLFWSYMPMKYIGDNCFEMISFPVTMKFSHSEGETSFVVSGNYGWDLNDKLFTKE